MKLIIDVDEKLVCEGFERTFTEEERNILIRAIGNGVEYVEPKKGKKDNPTNGDMIKTMFPNALRSDYIENDMTVIYLQDENESEMVVPEDWWNAPYKEGDEE